jgi:hypothetical protein
MRNIYATSKDTVSRAQDTVSNDSQANDVASMHSEPSLSS